MSMVSNVGVMQPLPALPKTHYLNKGGFGEVFRDPRENGLCIKRFKNPLRGADAGRLARLIDAAATCMPSDRDLLLSRLSWPVEAYGDSASIHGYSMPEAPPEAWFTLVSAKRETVQLLQLKYLIWADYWKAAAISSPAPAVSVADRLAIAIDFHDVLARLHSLGLVYGDISANNVCVRRSSPMRVFLLDADSVMTPAERAADHQQSPEWDVPGGLDSVAEERARFALFVWRLLREELNERPDAQRFAAVDARVSDGFGALVAELYSSGELDAFERTAAQLRLALPSVMRDRMFEDDLARGFARRLVRWPVAVLSTHQRELRDRAVAHLRLEALIRSSSGFERRLQLRTASVQHEFVLDLEPGVESAPPPRSIEELEQLIYDAQFTVIAGHLASVGLGPLESHSWVDRAARHALSAGISITPEVNSDLQRTTIRWDWPAHTWVNAAELEVTVDGRAVREVVVRDSNDRSALRELRSAPGTSGRVRVTPCVRSPHGLVVPGGTPAERTYLTPAPPKPPRPRAGTGTAPAAVQIIDPAAEARALEAARRARVKRRWVTATGLVLVAGLAFAAYWFLLRPPAAPSMRAVADSNGLELSWRPVDAEASVEQARVRVESSVDAGVTWQVVRTVDGRAGSLRLRHPEVDTRYRAVDLHSDQATGSADQPVVAVVAASDVVVGVVPPPAIVGTVQTITPPTSEFRWQLPAGVDVAYFEVRAYGTLGETSGVIATTQLQPAATFGRFDVADPSATYWIRAVNTVGQSGPWTQLTPATQG